MPHCEVLSCAQWYQGYLHTQFFPDAVMWPAVVSCLSSHTTSIRLILCVRHVPSGILSTLTMDLGHPEVLHNLNLLLAQGHLAQAALRHHLGNFLPHSVPPRRFPADPAAFGQRISLQHAGGDIGGCECSARTASSPSPGAQGHLQAENTASDILVHTSWVRDRKHTSFVHRLRFHTLSSMNTVSPYTHYS